MAKTKPVLCAWVVCSCNSFDSCNKCGGKGGIYEPIKGTNGDVQAETKRCVDIIMSSPRVPGIWQIMLRDAIMAKKEDMAKVDEIVRVTVPPWEGERGTVESIDGAYNIIRLDSSKHPEDVQELYPSEFVVLCQGCEHDTHEPGKCEVLHIYARGPKDPPGNQSCLCGIKLDTVIINSNEDAGWNSALNGEEK